jgi:hypothetical protein
VKKDGKTQEKELVLSHDINNSITTGFYKGTEPPKIPESLHLLQKCILDIGHPMLLPVIIYFRDLGMEANLRQYEARETVRALEKSLTSAAQVYTDPDITRPERIDLSTVMKDVVDCIYKVS